MAITTFGRRKLHPRIGATKAEVEAWIDARLAEMPRSLVGSAARQEPPDLWLPTESGGMISHSDVLDIRQETDG